MDAKFKARTVCVIAVLAFAAGSLASAWLSRVSEVRADSERVFELMVYHTEAGKVPALESIFRDVSPLQEKHHLHVAGYWVPNDDSAWKDTFVYLVAHPSLDEAKKNWDALHADPAFAKYRTAAAPLIHKIDGAYQVDEVFMRPADYSEMK